MKIKADFVTNSSSSSFVVMGAYIEAEQLSEDLLPKIKKACKYEVTWEDVLQCPMEYLEDLFERPTDFDFSTGHPWGDGTPMIGIPYERMKDDETKSQFRDRVQKGIKDTLGIDVTPGHIEECWEDR